MAWDNVVLTLTYLPPRCGDLRFDVNRDGDVDQAGFASFQLCYTGDGRPISSPGTCDCMDSGFDSTEGALNDVDQIDLQAFETFASGPGILANVACDDALPNPPNPPDLP